DEGAPEAASSPAGSRASRVRRRLADTAVAALDRHIRSRAESSTPRAQPPRGSQRKRRSATSAAPAPPASIIRIGPPPVPRPAALGSKTPKTASSKCRTGKSAAMAPSQDVFATGKNVPEMKRIGNSRPLTMAGDAVATGISDVIATARLQKQNAPTANVSTRAPKWPGKLTP